MLRTLWYIRLAERFRSLQADEMIYFLNLPRDHLKWMEIHTKMYDSRHLKLPVRFQATASKTRLSGLEGQIVRFAVYSFHRMIKEANR